jgi:hypothetical protein
MLVALEVKRERRTIQCIRGAAPIVSLAPEATDDAMMCVQSGQADTVAAKHAMISTAAVAMNSFTSYITLVTHCSCVRRQALLLHMPCCCRWWCCCCGEAAALDFACCCLLLDVCFLSKRDPINYVSTAVCRPMQSTETGSVKFAGSRHTYAAVEL